MDGGDDQPAAVVQQHQQLGIKDLDTGEMISFEEYERRQAIAAARMAAGQADEVHSQLGEEQDYEGAKKPSWVKANKLGKWAKSAADKLSKNAATTLSNVRERIEEAKERRRQDTASAAGDPQHGLGHEAQASRGSSVAGGHSAYSAVSNASVFAAPLGNSSYSTPACSSYPEGPQEAPGGSLPADAGYFMSGAGAFAIGQSHSAGPAAAGAAAALPLAPLQRPLAGAGPSDGAAAAAAGAAAVTASSAPLPPVAAAPPVHAPVLGKPPRRESATGAAAAGPAAAAAPVIFEDSSLIMERDSVQRMPLLGDDEAGPSSRVPGIDRSFLHRPAPLSGGRRGGVHCLQQVRLIQEVYAHEGVVWVARFSRDAQLLATGGRDGVLRVWSVYSYSHLSARKQLIARSAADGAEATAASGLDGGMPGPSVGMGDVARMRTPSLAAGPLLALARPPLLSQNELLALSGHRGDILDLSWSQARLVLTAGADASVRLWYVEGGGECLRLFEHPDFVPSVCFHPASPRRFVSGCADGKVRVWSVEEGEVQCSASFDHDLVTRVLFSADGSRVVAGTLRGQACEYDDLGRSLDHIGQIDVKNFHSGSARKITGLCQALPDPRIWAAAAAAATAAGGPAPRQSVAGGGGTGAAGGVGNGGRGGAHRRGTGSSRDCYLISSADSRVRLYVGFSQVPERKFKGHRNTNTAIAASLSPSCSHVISGSDDGWVYLWDSGLELLPLQPPGTAAAGAQGGGAAGGAGGGGSSPPVPQLRVAGKVKEGAYEAFQIPEPTAIVAIFAPDVCRLGRNDVPRYAQVQPPLAAPPPMPAAGASRQKLAAAAAAAAAAAVPNPLAGSLFVVAGFSGKLYVYENLPNASLQQQPAS